MTRQGNFSQGTLLQDWEVKSGHRMIRPEIGKSNLALKDQFKSKY